MADIDDFIARVRDVANDQTTLGQAFDCLKVAEELERLRDLCYEAQAFIEHNKNCSALMGWAKDCSCGYDEMWRKLNV